MQWIENSDVSSAIRQSSWLYPFIEILHLFGIVLVAGAAVMFDIQLLTTRANELDATRAHRLLSWSKRGLLLTIPTGLLLFSTNAVALSADVTFWLKMFLLVLAATNAYLFHIRVYRPHLDSKQLVFRWQTARVNAVASIILWMSIIACGRLLAY